MNPKLEGHLDRVFQQALCARALAYALDVIIDAPQLHDLAIQIAQKLSEMTGDISGALDSAEIMRASA